MPAFHNGAGLVAPMGGPKPYIAQQLLGPCQWYNYHWQHIGDPLYNPMVKYAYMATNMSQSLHDALLSTGQAWLFLNEPDIHNQGDPAHPMEAIRGLQNIHRVMKLNGKTFRWMGPNIAHSRAWGCAWLDEFLYLLKLYGIPLPEAWAVHHHQLPHTLATGYIWNAFDDWWDNFRTWMINNNCVRQVFLSEVSAGRYWPAVHSALLEHITKRSADVSPRFLNFQGFFWFSTNYDDSGWDGDLIDNRGQLTSIGHTFRGVE